MELCFALINSRNFSAMSKDLIAFMEKTGEVEFKQTCSSSMRRAIAKYAPTNKDAVDFLFMVLKGAGNHVMDDVISHTIQLASRCPDLHAYIATESLAAVKNGDSTSSGLHAHSDRQPLVQVCCWCLGEFGGSDDVIADDVIEFLESVLASNHTSLATKQYALLSAAKLHTRVSSTSSATSDKIKRVIEFSMLFTKFSSMSSGLLEKMPVFEVSSDLMAGGNSAAATTANTNGNDAAEAVTAAAVAQPEEDLLGGLLGQLDNGPTTASTTAAAVVEPAGNSLMDLLGGITDLGTAPAAPAPITTNGIGGGGGLADLGLLGPLDSQPNGNLVSPSPASAVIAPATTNNSVMDLLSPLGDSGLGGGLGMGLGVASNPPSAVPAPAAMPIINNMQTSSSVVAYDKNNVRIAAEQFERGSSPGEVSMKFVVTSTSPTLAASDFVLQVAVPKSMQIKLEPASSTSLSASQSIRQSLTVRNPKHATLKMKLRIDYKVGDSTVQDMAQVDTFPPEISTW